MYKEEKLLKNITLYLLTYLVSHTFAVKYDNNYSAHFVLMNAAHL